MGTKVHSKSYLPGYCSMRDLNEDSNSSSWPVCYGDKPITNGQYYNGFTPGPIMDVYPKDALKQKMLEHEAVFRSQVYELHRLYRTQQDLMEEVRRKEASIEPSSSSSRRGSHMPSEDAQKWHMAGFPLLNSPVSCTNGYNSAQLGQFSFLKGLSPKNSELLDSRTSKVRKNLFDLELPADEYVDTGDHKKSLQCKVSDVSNNACNEKLQGGPEIMLAESHLTDLNKPVQIDEAIAPSSTNLLGRMSNNGETKGVNLHSNGAYVGVNGEMKRHRDGFLINSSIENKYGDKGRLSHIYGPESISMINLKSLQDKLPITSHNLAQGMLNRSDHHLGNRTEDMWRDHHSLKSFDKCGTRHKESHLAEAPRSDPFYFPSTWAHSFTRKIAALESCSSRVGDTSKLNRFYHGSASGSKELNNADYVNRSRVQHIASENTINRGFGHFTKGNLKPMLDINLNEEVTKISSDEDDDDVTVIDVKGKPSALPWLRNKPTSRFSCKTGTVADLNQPSIIVFPPSEKKTENNILGVPIFEAGALNDEPSSSIGKGRKKFVIDMNVECEPEDEIQTSGACVRDYIDLNSCVTDCEDTLASSYESKTMTEKTILDIDLESPAVLEEDKNKQEPPLDEVLRNVAESILSISSSACPEASVVESLKWFADTVSLFVKDEEMDDFEEMTLRMPLMKPEDYIPAPFVPEFQSVEDSSALPARPRRVQSRRGRQRRDFQRDILPGLVSLSRNDVTEDIQTFSGMMRATGHNWTSGLTRRNGGGRSRRRAVVQNVAKPTPNPATCTPLMQQLEGGLKDRSLTGWGKTTRRPRRQRCPPPVALVLT